ncbi:MAG: sulfurtransferase [Bowdeniella nasicola]|nr:sulfurtransferase [Bowdeniella nasicola]
MIDPFVTWKWCEGREVQLADVRWHLDRSGYADYAAGHLPGAVFLDLDRDLASEGAPTSGRHPLPTPEAFAKALGRVGIDGSRPVVAYDSSGGIFAARLVWMLRIIGYEAALLTGPLPDIELEVGWPQITPVRVEPRPWPADATVGTMQVLEAIRNRSAVLIDARPRERFRGDVDDLDARPGHLPGAHAIPCRENIEEDGALRPGIGDTFRAAGIDEDTPVISYCGSGVTACHNLLVLEHLGLGSARLFAASFSGWAADERLPVATGD